MTHIICRGPQSQSSDAARPQLYKLARHGPWSVGKRLSSVHEWCDRSKPGCWMEGSCGYLNNLTVCHMGTAIKHPVPDRVKP